MRFYVPPNSIFPEKNLIEIKDKEEIHHIRDVMRLEAGASVDVFDGISVQYMGNIVYIDKNIVRIKIEESIAVENALACKVTLYQAIPKKSKIDFIIEKAVELGVERIVPIATERTIPFLKKNRDSKKERWVRIVKAASKQSGRVMLPNVSNVMDFNNALIEAVNMDLVIFAALDKKAKPLRLLLSGVNPSTVAVFIGPEGDFSEKEIQMAKDKGCEICSLGALVLKVETAAIYVLSCLNHEFSKG